MSTHPDHDALIAIADALRDAASGTSVPKIQMRKLAADLERLAATPPPAGSNSDYIVDSNWLAGAQFGFARGINGEEEAYRKATEARRAQMIGQRRTPHDICFTKGCLDWLTGGAECDAYCCKLATQPVKP